MIVVCLDGEDPTKRAMASRIMVLDGVACISAILRWLTDRPDGFVAMAAGRKSAQGTYPLRKAAGRRSSGWRKHR